VSGNAWNRRRWWLGVLLTAMGATGAPAQQAVTLEQAVRAAQVLLPYSAKVTDAPVKVEPDPEMAAGLSGGDLSAAVFIPDRRLGPGALQAGASGLVPAGQLWLLGVVPTADGKPVELERLRVINVQAAEQQAPMTLYFVALRRRGPDAGELLVYGVDREPLATVKLQRAQRRQRGLVELEARGASGHSGTLTLHLWGRFQAQMPMTAVPLEAFAPAGPAPQQPGPGQPQQPGPGQSDQ
jgi:hypothetical protein